MDTLFKTQAYRILELFIEQSNTDFSARGIARELGISHPTALKNLRELEKLGLIGKNERTLYPTYRANTVGENYMSYKREHIVFSIRKSGLVLSAFEKKLRKNVNILFERDITMLSPELRSNILNGVVVYGFVKVDKRRDDGRPDDLGEMP